MYSVVNQFDWNPLVSKIAITIEMFVKLNFLFDHIEYKFKLIKKNGMPLTLM